MSRAQGRSGSPFQPAPRNRANAVDSVPSHSLCSQLENPFGEPCRKKKEKGKEKSHFWNSCSVLGAGGEGKGNSYFCHKLYANRFCFFFFSWQPERAGNECVFHELTLFRWEGCSFNSPTEKVGKDVWRRGEASHYRGRISYISQPKLAAAALATACLLSRLSPADTHPLPLPGCLLQLLLLLHAKAPQPRGHPGRPPNSHGSQLLLKARDFFLHGAPSLKDLGLYPTGERKVSPLHPSHQRSW